MDAPHSVDVPPKTTAVTSDGKHPPHRKKGKALLLATRAAAAAAASDTATTPATASTTTATATPATMMATTMTGTAGGVDLPSGGGARSPFSSSSASFHLLNLLRNKNNSSNITNYNPYIAPSLSSSFDLMHHYRNPLWNHMMSPPPSPTSAATMLQLLQLQRSLPPTVSSSFSSSSSFSAAQNQLLLEHYRQEEEQRRQHQLQQQRLLLLQQELTSGLGVGYPLPQRPSTPSLARLAATTPAAATPPGALEQELRYRFVNDVVGGGRRRVEDDRTESAATSRRGTNARKLPSSSSIATAATVATPVAVVTTPPGVVVKKPAPPQYRATHQREYQWVQRAARAAAQQQQHAATTLSTAAATGSRSRPLEVDSTSTLTALGTSMRQLSSPYIDTSAMMGDPTAYDLSRRRTRGGVTEPFPEKLHRVLLESEQDGQGDIISFFSHGRAFGIHDPKRFETELMPKYYKQSRLSSFQRQLNLYGFTRIVSGPDSGGYYHELFLQGRQPLATHMRRVGVPKGLGIDRRKSQPSRKHKRPPDFYAMRPCV